MNRATIEIHVRQCEQAITLVSTEWKWLSELGRMNWQAALDGIDGGDYYTPEKMAERERLAKEKYPPDNPNGEPTMRDLRIELVKNIIFHSTDLTDLAAKTIAEDVVTKLSQMDRIA